MDHARRRLAPSAGPSLRPTSDLTIHCATTHARAKLPSRGARALELSPHGVPGCPAACSPLPLPRDTGSQRSVLHPPPPSQIMSATECSRVGPSNSSHMGLRFRDSEKAARGLRSELSSAWEARRRGVARPLPPSSERSPGNPAVPRGTSGWRRLPACGLLRWAHFRRLADRTWCSCAC